MTTLLKDLIHIPEQVHKGDFVLRLSEGVDEPEKTLEPYVVTPQLETAFDEALGIVKNAVTSGSSKAAYLHGSFGSGKSHFMAVLYLLLRRDPHARAVPELASVIDHHDEWLQEKKFLLVPYHLIGAKNLESALLGGYAAHVRREHPEAPVPAVFLTGKLFDDAEKLRQKFGDEAFFQKLRGAGENAWGDLGGWTAETYEAARDAPDLASFDRREDAPPASRDRQRLVQDLIESYFDSYGDVKSATGSGFVTLEQGLVEISRHARDLGYHGLVLFLDELILWLASHAADLEFLQREGQKLAKLVEAAGARRPIPIVSFVARQRDLKELVGEHVPGAEKEGFSDVLDWWEGRFDTVTLEDRNLPVIVEHRLLEPKNEAARVELDQAFESVQSQRGEVLEVLRGEEGSAEDFRRVYPFSPALVDTLVDVSSVLQRERTALKLLLHLLVSRRDELTVGDLVPVGDLWDVLASGDEPFSPEMKRQFRAAKNLWKANLRPLLEREHGLAPGVRPPEGTPGARALRNDERLLKTLLLAALAPGARPLEGLTPARLAALNHGTIQTPIPGREAQTALTKLKNWAADVGQIQVGEGENPVISVQLTEVDWQGVIDRARHEDNQGNRRALVKELLFEALDVEGGDQLFRTLERQWRGTEREVDVEFGNVREVADETLAAREGRWKLVVDYPFDPGGTPADDLERLERYPEDARTVCWLPAFFSAATQQDLGQLVILDHLLKGERFEKYAGHLPLVDRQAARPILENQRTQLRQRIERALEGAFGVRQVKDGVLDPAHHPGSHFHSLQPGFTPRPPVGPTLGKARDELADQMLAWQFPAHPRFAEKVTRRNLDKVYGEVVRAIEDPDQRIRVEDRSLRKLMAGIADPLKLGEMHEAHFILREHWITHLERVAAAAAKDDAPLTVGRLRQSLDEPEPMGLPPQVADLVIRVFAARTNRTFEREHGPYAVEGRREMPADVVLVAQEVPAEEDWRRALERAGAIFGITLLSQVETASNVSELAEKVRAAAEERRPAAEALVESLERRAREMGAGGEENRRLQTARAARELLARILTTGEAKTRLEALARAELPAEPKVVGRSLRSAAEVTEALERAHWQIFESCWSRAGEEETAAKNREKTRKILRADELAMPLARALDEALAEAARILSTRAPAKGPTAPDSEPEIETEPETPDRTTDLPGPDRSGVTATVSAGDEHGLDAAAAGVLLARLEEEIGEAPGRRLDLRWTLHRGPDEAPEDDGG